MPKKQQSYDALAFAKHSRDESERRQDKENIKSKTMTFISRIVLFLILPGIVGGIGLGASYFQNKYPPEGVEPELVDFDRDFIMPFIMTLIIVIIVGIRTRGFTTYRSNSLVQWPKLIKKKKVVKKKVVGLNLR